MWALVCVPVLAPGGRIEDLYAPQGQHLKELCGYDYMPETLRKVVSEWALAGLGLELQRAQASTWQKISLSRWELDYQAAVVYVDNNVKPLWTRIFTKSTKVSSTGRVQPAIVNTYVHSGAGTPIHFESHSGSAPLAPRVLLLLDEIEARLENPLGRLTVIDSECSSAALLKAFQDADRDLLTPLKTPTIKSGRFRFRPGSGWKPYRNGDQIREGRITLTSPKEKSADGKKVTVEARAIIVKRRRKETWTVLVTLAKREDWSCRGLADVYFGRWPNQEGFFRRANQALGIKKVHAYGKRVVANESALKKIKETSSKLELTFDKNDASTKRLNEVKRLLVEFDSKVARAAKYRAKREERVNHALKTGATHTTHFARASAELLASTVEERELEKRLQRLTKEEKELERQVAKQQSKITNLEKSLAKLEERTQIVQADAALDTLFTAIKMTLGMLIHFVIVEYFPHRPMEWTTFLYRLATIPGRRETTGGTITTTFHANPRDVDLMNALAMACQRMNKRRLKWGQRQLRYKVEWSEGRL
jgi:hypothetical protein